MVNLEVDRCTQDPETCPAVEQAFRADAFYGVVEDISEDATKLRAMLASFVVACTRGRCPGRAPERLWTEDERAAAGDQPG